jgi:transposase
MRTVRPPPALALTEAERAALEGWARAGSTRQSLALRARIVLACAAGGAGESVGAALGVTPQTVGKWRSRFAEAHLAGLTDAPRPGRPPSILPGDAEWVLVLTLLSTPRSSVRWTTRSMAEACGMSQSSVSRIWRGLGLKPSSTDSAHRRGDARTLARFAELAALYFDPRLNARTRVWRITPGRGIEECLAELEASAPDDGPLHVILCDARSADEALARRRQTGRARLIFHVAPRALLWTQMVPRWFPTSDGARARVGAARFSGYVRAEMDSRRGFDAGSGPYVWTDTGRRLVESVARVI